MKAPLSDLPSVFCPPPLGPLLKYLLRQGKQGYRTSIDDGHSLKCALSSYFRRDLSSAEISYLFGYAKARLEPKIAVN